MSKKKILFLSNHFIVLYSFRKELINEVIARGHEVYISTPEDADNKYFTDLGCKVIETPVDRHGINPAKDISIIRAYKKILKEVDPDIVFSYTIKPNIYGTLATNGTKYRQVCNITGTGGTFLKKSLLSELAKCLYKVSVKKAYKVFFQNDGDRDYFIKNKMVGDNYAMLPGSGVNLEQHKYVPMNNDEKVNFIFVGRVMGLKGIDQYFECAEYIKERYPDTNFYVAGFVDDESYKEKVHKYHDKGIINYIGFQKNIGEWIEKCHCTILPSIGGEGVPNALLESAATGRVCIGSDIPGTSGVIDHGKTGYLFEPGNGKDLISKVEEFLKLSFEERQAMGKAAREKVEREFDRQIVVNAYLDEIDKL